MGGAGRLSEEGTQAGLDLKDEAETTVDVGWQVECTLVPVTGCAVKTSAASG